MTSEHAEIPHVPLSGIRTTQEAASILGVSQHQVVQLIHAGAFQAMRTTGGMFLVDAASLERYRATRGARGRPWSAAVAWAALWCLSGLRVNWLDYHQDRRLWAKLAEVTARELVWLTRKRAQTLHLYVAPSQLDTLRSSMCLSGASSEHGQLLGVKPHEHITEGYLAYDDFEQLKEGLPHSPGLDPTAIIHLYRDLPFGTLPGNGQMPIAVAAADLAGSRETHEREQGLSWLERILTALHDSLA